MADFLLRISRCCVRNGHPQSILAWAALIAQLSFILFPATQASFVVGPWYKGCYPDTSLFPSDQYIYIPGDIAGLDTISDTDLELAVSCTVKCAAISIPQKYAVLSTTGVCFCATVAVTLPQNVSEGLCTRRTCKLESDSEECDGEAYSWLFDLSGQLNGLRIQSSQLLHGLAVQNISVVTIPANFAGVTYQFGFGDGVITIYGPSAIQKYLYIKSGYYTLTVNATTTSAFVTASQMARVITPPAGISFDTPTVFETNVDVSYAVVVREGTNMTISVESVSNSPVLPLQDAVIWQVGASVNSLMYASMAHSDPNSGTYIMPKFAFPEAGLISGFEFFVTKIGFLRIQVFRPICTQANFPGKSFCKKYRNCTTLSCPTPNMLVNQSTTVPTFGNSAPADYEFRGEVTFNVDSTGYKYMKVKTTDFKVQAGDVLGISLSGSGADIGFSVTGSAAEYFNNYNAGIFPGTSFTTDTLTKKGVEHEIIAHLSTTSVVKKTDRFTKVGVHTIKATATNEIGSHVQTKLVEVQERIVDLKITIPKPYNEQVYPVNTALTITTTKAKGSNVTYEWNIFPIINVMLNHTENTTVPTLQYNPTLSGIYQAFVKASNLINAVNHTVYFGVLEKIEDLIIQNQIGGKLLSPYGKKFNVSVTVVKGTNVTLNATLGNNQVKSFFVPNASPSFLYVFQFDPPSCDKAKISVKAHNGILQPITKEADVDIVCLVDGLKVTPVPTFSVVGGKDQIVLQSKQELVVTVKITTGSFVKYTFENGINSMVKDHSSHITPTPVTFRFTYPTQGSYDARVVVNNSFSSKEMTFKVVVKDCPPARLTITGSPIENNPSYVTTGEDYTVTGDLAKSNCTQPQVNVFKAELFSIDGRLTLDSTTLTADNLKYTVKKKTRSPGRYRITFVQEFTGSNGLEKTEYNAYFNIKQSDLVAIIGSGTSREMPARRRLSPTANKTAPYDFTLDASKSFDPDDLSRILVYSWSCRGLKLPVLKAKEKENLTCPTSQLKSLDKPTVKLTLSTAGFLSNHEFEFVLVVQEGNRTANYTQKILFVPGAPPPVEFLCITNCDTKWNAQEKIILRGKCQDCVDVNLIQHHWELLDSAGSPVAGIDQVDDEKVTLTGWNAISLVINAGILKTTTVYSVRLSAHYTNVKPIKKTVVTLKRATSTPPQGGSCVLTPDTGVVAQTKYQIQCRNWNSEDLPIRYTFMTKTISETTISVSSLSREDYPIWYAGNEPRNPANILPLGNKDKDYKLEIIVRISNAYGSYTQLEAKVATVKPVPQSSGSDNAAAEVIKDSKPKSNDSAALSQWAASAASILNVEETTGTTASPGATESTESKTKLQKLEETRANIIESLGQSNMKDIKLSGLKQMGEALTSVTSKTDQLNDKARDSGSQLLAKMAENFLSNNNPSTGAEDVEQTSLAIMGPLSNLMSATYATTDVYLTEAKSMPNADFATSTPSPTKAATTVKKPTKASQIKKQAQQTKNNVKSYMMTLELVSKRLLMNKVPGEKSMVTQTKSFALALQKVGFEKLANASFNTGDPSLGVTLPDLKDLHNKVTLNGSKVSTRTTVSCQTTKMNKILHTWDLVNAQHSASAIQSLELRSDDFQSFNVSNLTSEITISVKNRPEKLEKTSIKLFYPQEMKIEKQEVKSIDLPLIFQFDSPDASPSNLTVLIQYGKPPSKNDYDIRLDITNNGIALSKSTGNVTTNSTDLPLVRNSYIRIIDSKTIIMWNFLKYTYGSRGTKDVYFNFFYYGDIPQPVYVSNIFTYDLVEYRRARNYTMRSFSCSCLYWDAARDKWSDEGCRVDTGATDFDKTVCKCNHLTAFGGFYVKPNPIPALTGDMFLKGYVVFVTVTCALLLFVIGLVFARRADKKDIFKVGVCPLPDNNPYHHYLYEITVWTGLRRTAGTKSNVYFILSGDNGDTDIRHLKDPERETFQRSSSDVFVFSTENGLGDLSHIRLWHDNSGGGWYIRKIVVNDLQTDKTYQFLCNRWLAVDQDDGQVEMVAPVSGKDELTDFNYVFLTKTRNDLTDGHLWFSIYARPPRSPFTRVQRLACCMSLLMTSMTASAMFYGALPKPTPQTANYAFGLKFTWQQIYVALISTAITVPINVIIVTLFRSSKPKDVINIKKVSPERSASKASMNDNNSVRSVSSDTASHPESPEFNMQPNSEIPLLERNKKKNSTSVKVKIGDGEKKKKEKENKPPKEPYLFPYWCVYVAWFLTFCSIVAGSTVVIIYGMVFGNSKSWEWLSSITLSFVSDILVIQPVKVFVIAVFFALVVKRVEDERPQVEQQGRKLAEDEEWLHTYTDTSIGTAVDTTTLKPPDELKLDAMRTLRFKERKMNAVLREILLYTFYVFITLSISYSLREEQGFWQTLDLEEVLQLKVRDAKKSSEFNKVLSYNDFWSWAEKTLVPSLFPTPWYTDPAYPLKTREFPGKLYINDLNHKIVNGIRLRQVRVKPNSCDKTKEAQNIVKVDCVDEYGFTDEEQSNYISNWTTKAKTKPALTRENQPWIFQTWQELDSYPFLAELTTYYGGGYTLDLFPKFPNIQNLRKLKAQRWLDRHTRALFVEFALFNPATNLFSVVTIVFEFAATGGCIHYHSVHTFKLYRYTTGYAFFTIVCEVLFVLCLILYLYREIKEWHKLRAKYFTQFWNLVEVCINILSLVTIGFYFYREKLANDLLRKLPAKTPDKFINFQFAAYCDQIFIYIVSLIVFFISIKFIKLLRFNRRMSILADTLKDAWYPLGMFGIVMGIVLLGSFAFGTIVFGVSMYGYRNMLVTAATQISLLLGKFNFYEYEQTNRIIGPLFFLGYIIMVNWILMNMFVSIINDSYEVVSNNLAQQSNDYEIVDFVMDRFKEFIGVGKTKKAKIEHNIRWDSAKAKIGALRAFSAGSQQRRKSTKLHGEHDELGGLANSVYWQYTPTLDGSVVDRELDIKDVNRTVDKFIECINLLYFDDVETAEKMSKKVKQEISNADFLLENSKQDEN